MGALFLIFLWKWKSGSSVALQRLSLHSDGLRSSMLHQAFHVGLRLGRLQLPSLSFPFH